MSEKNINKVLLICSEFPPGPGGIGNHAWNLAKNLNNMVSIDVLTISDYAGIKECEYFDQKEKFNIYRFKRFSISIITYIYRIFHIINYVRNKQYSHFILSGFFSLSMCPIIHLFNKKIITIGVLHGSELIQSNILFKFIIMKSLRCLNKIISVSHYTQSLIPIKTTFSQENIVIPNGVNKELRNYQLNINNPIRLSGKPCLLTVGSISHRKGQINLINALPAIKKKYPDVHYHCIGLPLEEKDVLDLAEKLNVSQNVTIHGFINNNELVNIYNQADILIMLSQNKIRSSAEGFGIAILEANLFGVPALGSLDTGIEDAIVNNKTGILVDPYSTKAIVEGIELLYEMPDKFTTQTVKWALDHSWDKITDKYLKVMINE